MGDWGKRIRLEFADNGGGTELYSIVSSELATKFRLREDNYETFIYPSSVTIGDAPNVLFINFADFNQAQYPMTLEYLGGASLRGQDIPIDAFELPATINVWKLNRHGDYEYIKTENITADGDNIGIVFTDGFETSYLQLTIEASGEIIDVTFKQGYETSYLKIASITVAGTYADASGTPL